MNKVGPAPPKNAPLKGVAPEEKGRKQSKIQLKPAESVLKLGNKTETPHKNHLASIVKTVAPHPHIRIIEPFGSDSTKPVVTLDNYVITLKDQIDKKNKADRRVSVISSISSEGSGEFIQCETEELKFGQVFTEPGRDKWSHEIDFLLGIIGYAVDLSNIWRFPHLCFKYGGGSFLIPYLLLWIFIGVPVFYMELIIGQYTRQGCITAWKLVPLFKGIGYCSVFVCYLVSFYYNVIMAWALLYMKDSFLPELPWVSCDNDWNSPKYCTELSSDSEPEDLVTDTHSATPGSEYFRARILRLYTTFWADHGENEAFQSIVDNDIISKRQFFDFWYPGWVNTDCVLALLCITLFLVVVLLKGIKLTGKVVWITATMPYVVLLLLLFRAMSLPGSAEGILFYITPQKKWLLDPDTWTAAAIQIFFSSGAGFGVHLTYASFNPFNHTILRDCIIASIVTALTCVLGGFVIFAYLGNLAYHINSNITAAISQGPDIVFRTFPDSMRGVAGAGFYSFLFFAMLLTLGIDSAIGGMESVITGLIDEFKSFFESHKQSRGILCIVLLSVSFCANLACSSRGGIYYFIMFDTYAVGVTLILSTMIQTIAIAWIFGLKELCDITEIMTGFRPNLFFRLTWKFISPALLLAAFISMTVFPDVPKYDNRDLKINHVMGLWITIVPILLCVPLIAIIQICNEKGPFRLKFLLSISPVHEHDTIIEEGTGKRYTWAHWLYVGGICDKYSAIRELEEILRLEKEANDLRMNEFNQISFSGSG